MIITGFMKPPSRAKYFSCNSACNSIASFAASLTLIPSLSSFSLLAQPIGLLVLVGAGEDKKLVVVLGQISTMAKELKDLFE
ncbi:hypothetical protein ACH5RR_007036 [Cinchona calisaya]|uniref:Uncharacterized protein n=1 Tax=Cinchona calisaya TaxID=153742 RepID=A0ABD3AQR8_9GENT